MGHLEYIELHELEVVIRVQYSIRTFESRKYLWGKHPCTSSSAAPCTSLSAFLVFVQVGVTHCDGTKSLESFIEERWPLHRKTMPSDPLERPSRHHGLIVVINLH